MTAGTRELLAVGASIVATAWWVVAMSADPALAASPWWHLSSSSRPTNLKAGVAENDIQKLTVSATKGNVLLAEPQRLEEFLLGKRAEAELLFAVVPFNATAPQVQEALEKVFPFQKVLVTGGPGDEEGTKPYVITFPGQAPKPPGEGGLFPGTVFASGTLAAQEVFGSKEALSCEGAVGASCTAEASSTEVAKGKPDAQIIVTAANLGDANANGEATPVKLSDELPSGLKAVSIEAFAGNKSVSPGPVNCSLASLTCTFAKLLPPFDQIEVRIGVLVQGASNGELNEARITGGQAQQASVAHPITVSSEATPFGVDDYELTPEEEGGASDTQAGSHPFQLTTTLTLNQTADAKPAGLPKDTSFKWPPGLLGNPTVVQRCSLGDFLKFRGEEFVNACPPQTAVGVAMITINEVGENLGRAGPDEISTPVFNLEPEVGEPARFGFLAPGTPVFIDASVRTGEDYGVTVHSNNISQTAAFLRAEVTVWGVPGDPRHNGSRGNGCLREIEKEHLPCQPLEDHHPAAFLQLPMSCTGTSLQTTVEADSWTSPATVVKPKESALIGPLNGCSELPFHPSVRVIPDGTAASTPTGLAVDVHNPQEESLNATGLVEADVKDISVALPEGIAIDPAGADGLQACSQKEIGFTGVEPVSGADLFTSGLPAPRGAPAEPFCPNTSIIGTAKITTPILPNPLEGAVYIALQNENPFGSLVAMYLIAEDPVSGVLIKLAGETHLTETGQLVGTFKNSPQAPFEDAELHFFGGERAPLATPAHCGSYTTNATLTPWSGSIPVSSQSRFDITSGPNGAPCPGTSLPFSPSLTAGTTNIQAGSLNTLTTTMSREDGNQELQAVQLRLPPGLSGLLANVKLCSGRQADEGTCTPESLIGETTVSAGIGPDPITVKGGRVYVTGPYHGAPFGLSIVNPVKAGPFDLEHDTSNPNNQPPCDCLVVRARIEIDPHTAALTAATDPTGPYAIPHIIDGVPVQIKHVNVTINRTGFTFNPTNCNPLAITAKIEGHEGASQPVAVPFQVHDCALLAFKPAFKVSTSGKTSKANGASLLVKLTYPKAPFGSQANIAKVKVDLPRQLPSRLSTLQKACTAAVFETNPASCPAAAIVGHARVITPLLPVPLTGPAYFVSHGNEAFPSLTIVLQGYGVTVDLVGTTFIKNGITSSTFNATPDVPFNLFELTLPEGKYSALAANTNLCKTTLAMPTAFIAQNGAQIHRSTKIAVTGCHKVKKTRKAAIRKSGGSSHAVS
jgi:hypothetical protein